MVRTRHCRVCTSPLTLARVYCSAPCAATGRRRRRRRRQRTIECARCHGRFRQTRRGNRFCSGACRQAHWRRTSATTRELRRLLRKDLRSAGVASSVPAPAVPALGCSDCGGPTLTIDGSRRYLRGCVRCLADTNATRIVSCPHAQTSYPARHRQPRRPVCLWCGAGIVTLAVAGRGTG